VPDLIGAPAHGQGRPASRAAAHRIGNPPRRAAQRRAPAAASAPGSPRLRPRRGRGPRRCWRGRRWRRRGFARLTRLHRGRRRRGRLIRFRRRRGRRRRTRLGGRRLCRNRRTLRSRLSWRRGRLQLRSDRVRFETGGRRFHADEVLFRSNRVHRDRLRPMTGEREAHIDVVPRCDRELARSHAAGPVRQFRLGPRRLAFELEDHRLRSFAAQRRNGQNRPAPGEHQAANRNGDDSVHERTL
jgi:hypothetical protein